MLLSAECAYTLKASAKSDVYSMGVVLMELVTGLMPTDEKFGRVMDMASWVQSRIALKSAIAEQDPALDPLARHEEESMLEVLEVALQCRRTVPAERPSSRQVARLLLHISLKFRRMHCGKKLDLNTRKSVFISDTARLDGVQS